MSRPRTARDRDPRLRAIGAALLVVAAGLLGGCGTAAGPSTPPNPASTAASPPPGTTVTDVDYVLHMLPHHRRALEVGALMAAQGSDPRVRDFGRRIVAEQTPERQRLESWVSTLGLASSPQDAASATGIVDDAALARLRTESGAAFDRDSLTASADSESGAAAMSGTELASGVYAPARELATAISTAPAGEIPALRALAAQL